MKIKSYLAAKTTQGFTLIELLVVIGILGILAAGLLAAIDPLEQIRKGNDANAKSAGVELAKAMQRYYTTHNAYPWDVAPDGAGCTTPALGAIAIGAGAFWTGASNCYDNAAGAGGLEQNGELKNTFKNNSRVTRAGVNLMTIFQTAAPARNVIVCFVPESRSVWTNLNETKYNADGTTGGACVPSAATQDTDCHWCAQ